MKKIILIISMLFIITSCGNNEEIIKNRIEIQNEETKIDEISNTTKNGLDGNFNKDVVSEIKIEEDKENDKNIEEINLKEKEFTFEKNQECKKYETDVKNKINYDSILMGELNIFYSSKLNTCAYSLIYYNSNQFIDYIIIKDILTNEEIKTFICTSDECFGNDLINQNKIFIEQIK